MIPCIATPKARALPLSDATSVPAALSSSFPIASPSFLMEVAVIAALETEIAQATALLLRKQPVGTVAILLLRPTQRPGNDIRALPLVMVPSSPVVPVRLVFTRLWQPDPPSRTGRPRFMLVMQWQQSPTLSTQLLTGAAALQSRVPNLLVAKRWCSPVVHDSFSVVMFEMRG